jgi:hypothetical protein
MAGRFEGLSDLEWKPGEDIFLEEPSKRGSCMPHAPYRHVLNSFLYILITGYLWCDLPRGEIWASKSSSHRWLKRSRNDKTFEYIQARIKRDALGNHLRSRSVSVGVAAPEGLGEWYRFGVRVNKVGVWSR